MSPEPPKRWAVVSYCFDTEGDTYVRADTFLEGAAGLARDYYQRCIGHHGTSLLAGEIVKCLILPDGATATRVILTEIKALAEFDGTEQYHLEGDYS
jgi:hypothetical protein